jgi:hypothetical protein
MTKTNTSCAPLDIHKSKLAVTQLQSFSKGKTYVSLVFSTNSGKTMFENNFEKENAHEDIILTLNILITHSPQIVKANDFSLLKVQDFS